MLRGVTTAPTLRAEGSILQTPGYDVASGLIFDPCGVVFPDVPEEPTQEEALAAIAKFDPLFAEFPFVDEHAHKKQVERQLVPLREWVVAPRSWCARHEARPHEQDRDRESRPRPQSPLPSGAAARRRTIASSLACKDVPISSTRPSGAIRIE